MSSQLIIHLDWYEKDLIVITEFQIIIRQFFIPHRS